jgi:hypothetical protein
MAQKVVIFAGALLLSVLFARASNQLFTLAKQQLR